MAKYVWCLVLLMGLLCLKDADVAVVDCPKFDTVASLVIQKTVNGRCYYGFGQEDYAGAETLCESEGCRLPNYQEEQLQLDVFVALGSNYGQHWTGLKLVDSKWVWWDNGVGTDVTTTRWEGGDGSNRGHTQTTSTTGKWKSVDLSTRYNVVCEDAGITETTTTTTTTTTAPSFCNRTAYVTTGSSKSQTYRRFLQLDKVIEMSSRASDSMVDCARLCLRIATCCSFTFDTTSTFCRHFTAVEVGGDTVNCPFLDGCFTSI